MGRFFLLVLVLQTIDKGHLFFQELFFQDLSLVYYEVNNKIHPRSLETRLCTYFGTVRNCVGFLSQLYSLWLAVLIKQILKDPIHRLNRYIYFYHALTIMISMALTGIIHSMNDFGVEETMQCGINNTFGLTDEFIMLSPLLLCPLQLFLIMKIMRQTPHIVRVSLRRFVAKYIVFMMCMFTSQGLQLSLIIFGSLKPWYFSYDREDGYKRIRFAYLLMDKWVFLTLAVCTLCERVFFDKCIAFYKTITRKQNKRRINREKKHGILDGQSSIKSETLIEFEQLNPDGVINQSLSSSDDEDNFEDGDNCVMIKKDDYEIEDESKFEKFVDDNENQVTGRDSETLQSKTNYFIVNTVLISICNTILLNKEKNKSQNVVGMMTGLVKFAQKVITYQLQKSSQVTIILCRKDDDINTIIDLAQFYQKNRDICVSDITSKDFIICQFQILDGKKMQVKITEYGPELLKGIRRQSGYSDDYLIKYKYLVLILNRAFSPKENEIQMKQFQEGSGKSASFFFYTNNKQFVIKTLKEEELHLLARQGLLEKYYNYLKQNPKSLIARFYGVLTVKIKYMKPLNVIIMDNIMGEHVEEALRVYDLKGSTFQRITLNPSSDLSVRKDLNFIDEKQFRVVIDQKNQDDILQRMAKDKEFLKQQHLMDYSLLLIFFKNENYDSEEEDFFDDNNNQSRSSGRPKMSEFMRKDSNGNLMQIQEVSEEERTPSSKRGNPNKRYSQAFDQDIKPKNPKTENSIEFDNFLGDQAGDQPSNLKSNANKMTLPIKKQSTTSMAFTKTTTVLKNLTKGLKKPDAMIFTVQPNHAPLKPRTNEFIMLRNQQDKRYYYRLGIIDFLQKYNRRKRIETKWLQLKNRNVDPTTFSCVDPVTYGDRFYSYMQTHIFSNEQSVPAKVDNKEELLFNE